MLCVATFSLPERRSSTVYRRWQQQLGRHRQPLGQRRPRLGRWLELHARDQHDIASNRSMRTRAMQATSTATTTSPSHPSPTASNLPNSTTYRGRLVRPLFALVSHPFTLPNPCRCSKINMSQVRRGILRLMRRFRGWLPRKRLFVVSRYFTCVNSLHVVE